MTTAIFPSPPSSCSGIYCIGPEQWGDIKRRAELVVEAAPIADEMTRVIPNYRALLASCRIWQSTTAPGLVSQAILTDSFSSDVVEQFGAIRRQVQGLSGSDPLPAGIGFIIRVKFGAFARTAADRKVAIDALTPGIRDFAEQNRVADVALAHAVASLGDGWGAIAGPLTSLDQSLGAASSSWAGLGDELGALAQDRVTVTTADVLEADVDAATSAWAALGRQALALSQNAT